LKRIESLRGADRMILSMLADCYTATNQRSDADAILARIAKLPAKDETAYGELALQQARLGNLSDAIATLQAARAMGPLSAGAASLLVADYLKQKNLDAAWTAAKSFNESSHGSAEAQVMLGVVALRREGPDAARGYFVKALNLDPGLVSAQLDLAGAYRVEGKIAQARDVLDAAAKRDPNSLDIILARVDLERQQNDVDAEITWLERARLAAPNATQPRLTLVNLYLSRNQPDKALAAALELSRIDDNDPRSIEALARAQLANRQFQTAITTFQRLVNATNESAGAQLQLAQAYTIAGDRVNAGITLRNALDRKPDDPQIEAAVLEFARRFNEVDSFVTFLRDRVAVHPKDPNLELVLGRLLFAEGQKEDALTALAAAVAKGGGSAAKLELAQAQAATGAPDTAIATLRAALADAPKDPALRGALGRLLGATGHYKEAIAELEGLSAEEPKDPLILNDLAWLYLQTGDPRALATAQQAHLLAPNVPTIDDTLGWILVRKGKANDGLKLLEAAASKPGAATPGMKYRLAVAFDQLGRPREARAAVDAALASGTNFSEAKDAEALRDRLAK
jgi:putative PEP-CTERM system TPR-repeat lipoprotein